MKFLKYMTMTTFLFVAACGESDPCDNKATAWGEAEGWIKTQLHNPRSATFPDKFKQMQNVVKLKRCEYVVPMTINAENGFGGYITQSFSVSIVYDENKKGFYHSIK